MRLTYPLAAVTVCSTLLLSASAGAQYSRESNEWPQDRGLTERQRWLVDRQYREGAGFRVGDFELHPGIGADFGYDSNFLRRNGSDIDQRIELPIAVPPFNEPSFFEGGGDDSDAGVRRTAFLTALLSRAPLAKAIRERDKELHRQLFELETFQLEGKSAKKSPPKTKRSKISLSLMPPPPKPRAP